MRACLVALVVLAAFACSDRETRQAATGTRNFLLVTVDTMRADRLGSYGDARARTPVMDALAARGARFTNAFAVAPITLPSHASLLTGRYPPGHGSRHNGMRIDPEVPTLAGVLVKHGFATAAFVGAFPLDRRFGLNQGFETYGDAMPRGADGRTANERPGAGVIDDARAWLEAHRGRRFFLWVHLFEPHAPYGDARSGRSVAERYGDEIAEADRQIGRLLEGLREAEPSTLIAVAADHGEAFGEHGEIAHSVFVYDTTLRVPVILAGPGLGRHVVETPVSLVDLVPTVLARLGAPALDADGVDLGAVLAGQPAADRTLYAESFAPLLDFGWSPLRTVRTGGWKYIAAPTPELYQVAADREETRNAVADAPGRATALAAQVARYSSDQLPAPARGDREAEGRLRALGYASGSRTAPTRVDPKDRRALAARIGQVTSGELHGLALERVLREILGEDPGNPLAHLRLGFVLLESRRCAQAVAHFRRAIDARYPSADPYLGLAACQADQKDLRGAADTLRAADAVEPDNPVVLANLGLMLSDGGDPQRAVGPLERALSRDPDLHQARFGLAVAFARAGRRTEAAAEARELLRRLPADAPQRGEVERLLAAVK